MNEYTIYCTSEQIKKALELGAPIEICDYNEVNTDKCLCIKTNTVACYRKPTVEQMIGWLRSKNILFRFDDEEDYWSICDANDVTNDDSTPLRWYSWAENKELKAIDAALEHLKSKN